MYKFLDKSSTNKLNLVLNLHATGDEQDWDIELASPERIREFVDFYESKSLEIHDQYALLALILASFEELLEQNKEDKITWNRIKSILNSSEQYNPLIIYWQNSQFHLSKFLIQMDGLNDEHKI